MNKSFDEIVSKVKECGKKTVAVAAAQDEAVLEAVKEAKARGIADAILVGDEKRIREIAASMDMDLTGFQIIDEPDMIQASLKAVKLAHDGVADMYMKEGKSPAEALSLACPWMYSDNVTVMLTENAPEQITLLRTTRPMVCVMEKDATYIATSRYALPEELTVEAFDLPLFYGIEVRREGVTVTKHRMDMEPVMEMTPYTYAESYKRIEALL